ncbi:MAG: hydroxymethylglutaryl-CoA reductase [Mangrovibacterium sp.]
MKNGNKIISGFSRLSRSERIKWLEEQLDRSMAAFLDSFELRDRYFQEIIAELSENQLSNFHLPFSVAPNFLVNGKMMVFPLVTEESSVVAALAKAAGFWAQRGGFHTCVVGTEKRGQVHFRWSGDPQRLHAEFPRIRERLIRESSHLTGKMESRGGGITKTELKYLPEVLDHYYQIDVGFDTCDAMGANFINSCMEQYGKSLRTFLAEQEEWPAGERDCTILMAILSNYVPNSRARAWVECPLEMLGTDPHVFAEKFCMAVHIARQDVSRAVTHNKGIFNGIDALAIATGNDFRAIEAGGHAYASREGHYAGLSEASICDGRFLFSLEMPVAVGVVGGVTSLHPMTGLAMQILENPGAGELMQYLVVAGLASNWAAIQALVTTGIQKGHMKMHLSNILVALHATDEQKLAARLYFEDREVSFTEVEHYLRNYAGH